MRHVTLAFALALAGCAAGGPAPPLKATVLGLESGLTAAERLAANYAGLARCTGANGPLCSDGATVVTIKGADIRAYDAVTAAQAAVDADPAASGGIAKVAVADAAAALSALQAAIAKLPQSKAP